MIQATEDTGWLHQAFARLGGTNARLTTNQIRSRATSDWIRKLTNDGVASGRLPMAKAVRTCRIVRLLMVKAEQNVSGCLSEQEFAAAVRVIRQPNWKDSSLEAEVAWVLFAFSHEQEITLDDFSKLRACWAALGKVSNDADANSLHTTGNGESAMLTKERYQFWLEACCVDEQPKSNRPLPPAAQIAIQSKYMSFGSQTAPQDHLRRSTEAKFLSLVTAPMNLAAELMNFCNTRGLKPSRPSTARSRVAAADASDDFHGLGPSPRVARKVTPDAESLQTFRKARLQPYMEVKVPLLEPDGQTVYEIGTLMTGWGIRNKNAVIPHSEPPKRWKDARTNQDSPRQEEPPKQDYLLVVVRGIEKWVPRAAVMPLKPSHTKR